MKTKLEMAHDYAMLHMVMDRYKDVDDLEMVQWANDYVDALESDANKRNVGGVPEAISNMDDPSNYSGIMKAKVDAELYGSGFVKLIIVNNEFSYERVDPALVVLKQVDRGDWQPDWSQAPDGYDWWAFDGVNKKANWYKSEPYIDDDEEGDDEWNIELQADTKVFLEAPSFDYKGDWKESLRKRP